MGNKSLKEYLKSVWNFIKRNATWFIIGLIAWLILKPGIAEIRTILQVVLYETIALALSGVAVFVFTKLDFVAIEKSNDRFMLGYIFLGVHILVALSILGIYIVQFAN